METEKKAPIASVITLMFANKGVNDNTDLIRCNILGLTIENMVSEGKEITKESIKKTSAFASVSYDVGCPDEFLDEIIKTVNNLR